MNAPACPQIVMIVDDDAEIREAFAELLGDEGYQVITAGHGGEALAKLRAGARPCVILLDLMMPVMNGRQFFVERDKDPALAAIPTVVISAGDGAAQAAAFGAEYLAKPIRFDRVLDVIERHCAGARS
jgi:CheY-like chemotaxis protein